MLLVAHGSNDGTIDCTDILEFFCKQVDSDSSIFENRKTFESQAVQFKRNLSITLLHGKVMKWKGGKAIKFSSIAFKSAYSPLEKN